LIDAGDRFDIVDTAGKNIATLIFRYFRPPASATAWIAAGLLSGCRSQMGPALRELALEVETPPGHYRRMQASELYCTWSRDRGRPQMCC
jgi:hypothetical protein